MYVPRFFIMNPSTEDLLIDGHHLREGMVVLIEDDLLRVSIDPCTGLVEDIGTCTDASVKQANKYNRWVTVTKLRISDKEVIFIGEHFETGDKMYYRMDISKAWYVAISSIPEIRDTNECNYGMENSATDAAILGRVVKNNAEKPNLKDCFNPGHVEHVMTEPPCVFHYIHGPCEVAEHYVHVEPKK